MTKSGQSWQSSVRKLTKVEGTEAKRKHLEQSSESKLINVSGILVKKEQLLHLSVSK